jgi:DNA repair exonuclease SbcCD ATPase subunit
MRCVELKNTTGLTLEGGPVTVIEGGSYVGEAMLETLKPGEERLVPFAVELSVHVLDNVDSFDEEVHKVVIRDGRLTRHSRRVQQTTYTFDNKAEAEQTVYLDHAREGASWKLVDTPAPAETTENHWRFRFALPAKKATRFVVKAQAPLKQTQALAGMDTQELALWLDQKRVDARTEEALRQVIQAQKRVAELEALLARLEGERLRIAREQDRIRENMKSLGDRSSEKELRERIVRTLNAQEDRLEQIAAELAARAAERDEARERVGSLLANLEFEGTR